MCTNSSNKQGQTSKHEGPGYIQAEGDTKQAKRMLQDDMNEGSLEA